MQSLLITPRELGDAAFRHALVAYGLGKALCRERSLWHSWVVCMYLVYVWILSSEKAWIKGEQQGQ